MSEPKKTVLGWTHPQGQAQPYDPNQYQQQQQVYPPQGYQPPPAYVDPYAQQQQSQPYAQQQQPVAQYPHAQAQPHYDYAQQYAQHAYAQPPQQPAYDPQYGYQQQQQYPQAQPHDHQFAAAQASYYDQGGHPPYGQAQAPYQGQYQASPPAHDTRESGERPIAGANATVGVSQRVRFIRLTYLHLLLAILAFAGLEWLLFNNTFLVTKVSAPLVEFALGVRWHWGVVLGVFMVVSWVADYWASHASSKAAQYMGLFLYVCAEALIFVPLLAIVEWKTTEILSRGGAEPHIIRDSAIVTLGVFFMLTLSVFISKKDFSFMRSGLAMVSGAALALIFMSIGFGFNLGIVFSVAMVVLAAGYILYQTSQVLAHYDPHQHVAAALALFSSVALMFWYVIRIFLRARE